MRSRLQTQLFGSGRFKRQAKYPGQSSVGRHEAQAGDALALLHKPAILFLDEPTAGLDPRSRRKIWAFLRHINQDQGCTLFLTTQYIEEAEQLAERVAFIDQGQMIARGKSGADRET